MRIACHVGLHEWLERREFGVARHEPGQPEWGWAIRRRECKHCETAGKEDHR